MKFFRRIIVLGALAAVIGGFWFVRAIGLPAGDRDTVHHFAIQSGEGVNAISGNLKREGLIRSSFAFETYLWLLDLEGRVIAGEYELRPTFSIRELTRILTTGETLSRERTITIIEGWNRKEIAAYLTHEGVASADAFLEKTEGYEGRLFPDTYRVFRDASIETIVEKMLGNFALKVTPELRAAIERQGRTLDEVLIMASILEKEVRGDEERRLAADLFWRRLAIGMALQADSTINFLTDGKRPRATFADLEIDSPYNTYKYRGLPPGPIGNPGLSAIRAAINPKPNNYWYFVTTEDDGRAVFAETFEEHNANRAKYFH